MPLLKIVPFILRADKKWEEFEIYEIEKSYEERTTHPTLLGLPFPYKAIKLPFQMSIKERTSVTILVTCRFIHHALGKVWHSGWKKEDMWTQPPTTFGRSLSFSMPTKDKTVNIYYQAKEPPAPPIPIKTLIIPLTVVLGAGAGLSYIWWRK